MWPTTIDLSKIFNGRKYMKWTALKETLKPYLQTDRDIDYTIKSAIEDGRLIEHVVPVEQPLLGDFYIELKGDK